MRHDFDQPLRRLSTIVNTAAGFNIAERLGRCGNRLSIRCLLAQGTSRLNTVRAKDGNGGLFMNGTVLHTLIALQWNDGRIRLDALVRLMNSLSESLQADVQALSRLDADSDSYEEEVRERVAPTLRRFTFDQRIRDECRALIRLLQFCGEDLSQSRGIDTTAQLQALASIDTAIASAERG